MTFSQRIGVQPIPQALHPEAMPDALRNSLWNAVIEWRKTLSMTLEGSALRGLWTDLWKLLVDQMPFTTYTTHNVRRYDYTKTWTKVREWYFKLSWAAVYDFMDFLIEKTSDGERLGGLVDAVLERELAAYRVVNRQLVPVTRGAEEGLFSAVWLHERRGWNTTWADG